MVDYLYWSEVPDMYNQIEAKVGDYVGLPVAQELSLEKTYNPDLTVDYSTPDNTNNYDIAEIHSQGNEFLFMDAYNKIGGAALKTGMLKASLKSNIVYALNMGCLMDELQQYVYANADTLTPQDVCDKQEQLLVEYSLTAKVAEDPSFKYFWAAIPHTFEDPFYYISYAASLIPALELFELSESGKRAEAIKAYNYIVSSDEQDYDALFRGAGLGGPFSAEAYPSIRDAILRYSA